MGFSFLTVGFLQDRLQASSNPPKILGTPGSVYGIGLWDRFMGSVYGIILRDGLAGSVGRIILRDGFVGLVYGIGLWDCCEGSFCRMILQDPLGGSFLQDRFVEWVSGMGLWDGFVGWVSGMGLQDPLAGSVVEAYSGEGHIVERMSRVSLRPDLETVARSEHPSVHRRPLPIMQIRKKSGFINLHKLHCTLDMAAQSPASSTLLYHHYYY